MLRDDCTLFPRVQRPVDMSALRYNVNIVSDGSYLVDPASSHMLVSKIKPCMS